MLIEPWSVFQNWMLSFKAQSQPLREMAPLRLKPVRGKTWLGWWKPVRREVFTGHAPPPATAHEIGKGCIVLLLRRAYTVPWGGF